MFRNRYPKRKLEDREAGGPSDRKAKVDKEIGASKREQWLGDDFFDINPDEPLPSEFKCHLHTSYKVLDLDTKLDEKEIKNAEIKIIFRNIHDQGFFVGWFKKLTNVKSLCVEARSIDSSFVSVLKQFIDSSPSLVFLHICAKNVEKNGFSHYHRHGLAGLFDNYSSLENVTVEAEDFDYDAFSHDYERFTERSRQVRKLVKEAKDYIATLDVEQKSRLPKQKEEKLIKLAPVYEKLWLAFANGLRPAERFLRLVASDDQELLDLLGKARKFHPLIAVQDGSLERIKRIFRVRPELGGSKVNEVYHSYQPVPVRLIDVATDDGVIQFLINEQKADATSLIIEDSELMTSNPLKMNNLLLKVISGLVIEPSNVHLFISYDELIYDGLACSIAHLKDENFKQIFSKYCGDKKIDISIPLEQGAYAGYTLFQLACLKLYGLKGTEIFSFIQEEIKILPNPERQRLLDSCFPVKNLFKEEGGITVWQYLTCHLHIDFLLQIMPSDKVDFTRSSPMKVTNEKPSYAIFDGYYLLQVFLQSVLDMENDRDNLNIRDLAKYYHLLKQDKVGRFENLQLKTHLNKIEQPVFCYASRVKLELALVFSINLLFPDFYFKYQDKRFNIFGYRNVSIFQACLLIGGDSFCAELLRKLFQIDKLTPESALNFLSEIIEADNEWQGCTLFQLAVVHSKSEFIQACLDCGINLSLVINRPYPEGNYKYAGWTPIQLAVHREKKGRWYDSIFRVLLNINGIDLSACYPNNVYLGGLNILQAALLDASHDPLKFSITGRNFNDAGIRYIVDRLDKDQVNYVCQERSSRFYGMTALHIAVSTQSEGHVKALLSFEKTDYTVVDSSRRTALEIAQFLRNTHLIDYIKNATKEFPQHAEKLKYHSEVCPSFDISCQRWIVSIARENNSEHAFLIFEGLQEEASRVHLRAVVWVAQLYLPKSSNSLRGGAKVDIEQAEEKLERGKGKTKHLLSSVKDKLRPLVQLTPGTMLFYVSAYVESKACERMIGRIKEAKNETVIYNISGTIGGHNCVTWAIEKYNLLVPESQKLPTEWSHYLFTSAKGFLNEEFVYIADASASRDLLREEVSRLSSDRQRLLESRDTLFARQNKQWSLLTFTSCLVLCNTVPFPAAIWLRLLLSFVGGGVAFKLSNSKFFSPREREYNEGLQLRRR